MKVEIKKNKKAYNEYAVTFRITEGAILTLSSALRMYADAGSAIADDLRCILTNAMKQADILE